MSTNTRELLRFTTVGSVDDGKSTLVGRILYDTKSILVDTMASVEFASRARGLTQADLALLTDGLRSEREQGITIDVAYRYFSTKKRSFILNDTPGHVQYTRNMVTGASNADVAVILVDARLGILEQTRRHLTILSLLGMKHVVLAVNKMDLVEFSAGRYAEIADAAAVLATALSIKNFTSIPVCALSGDNVVFGSESMPWYSGPTILEYLESVPVWTIDETEPFRFPVQYVIRPRDDKYHDYRAYAGKVSHGVVKVGDQIIIQPDGRKSTVVGIDGLSGPLQEAVTSQSIALRLSDDLDISRGALISGIHTPAIVSDLLIANVSILSDHSLNAGDRVYFQHGTKVVLAIVESIVGKYDLNSLNPMAFNEELQLNDLGVVKIRLSQELPLDRYADLPRTGSFLLVNQFNGATIAAGMITADFELEPSI